MSLIEQSWDLAIAGPNKMPVQKTEKYIFYIIFMTEFIINENYLLYFVIVYIENNFLKFNKNKLIYK